MTPFVILALVTLQRLAEIILARRNSARLVEQGAVEAGAGHYPAIVALHAGWLAGLWLLARDTRPSVPWLLFYVALQILRARVLVTLGQRWTTRILVLPGTPLVKRGPYRFMRHPNYAVVVGEIAALPLAFGLVWYALVFSALNAAVLAVRVRVEDGALARFAFERSSSPGAGDVRPGR